MNLLTGIYMNLFNNLILNLSIIELKCLSKLTKLYLKLGKNKLNYKSIHF